MRERILKVLSNVEAKIDFPEDDLPIDILKNIHSEVRKIKNEIEKILNDQSVGERIREGFKIAIVGPTNAGKSSLLNYLSKRDVAIVLEGCWNYKRCYRSTLKFRWLSSRNI